MSASDVSFDNFVPDQAPASVQGEPAGTGPITSSEDPASSSAMTNGGESGVDINNLDSFNDVEEVDPNASITDAIPPPPAGIHVLKVRPVKDGIAESARISGSGAFQNSIGFFTLQGGKKCLMIVLEYEVSEEGKPWNKQTRREWVNTMKSEGTGTTAVDTLLRVLTGAAGVGLSDGAKMKKLYDAVVVEPLLKGDLDWEFSFATGEKNKKGKDEYKTSVRGMKHFPEAGNFAGHAPLTEDPATGREGRTQFYVKQYLPYSHVG